MENSDKIMSLNEDEEKLLLLIKSMDEEQRADVYNNLIEIINCTTDSKSDSE